MPRGRRWSPTSRPSAEELGWAVIWPSPNPTTEASHMTTSTVVVKALPRRRFFLRDNLGRWDLAFSPYLFVSPFFLLFGLVGLFPLIYTGWVAIHDWDLIGGALG